MKRILIIIALSITFTLVLKQVYSQNDTIIVFDDVYPGLFPNILVEHNDLLYGTTNRGGINELGLVYSVGKDGGNYSMIHEFDNIDTGSKPEFKLFFYQGYLYGLCHKRVVCNSEGVLYRINLESNEYEILCQFSNTGGFFKNFIFHNDTFYIATVYSWITVDVNGENVVLHDHDLIPLLVEDDFVYGISGYSNDGYKNLISYNKQESTYDTLYEFIKYDFWAPLSSLNKIDNYLYGVAASSGMNTPWNEEIYRYDLINETIEVIYSMGNPERHCGIVIPFEEKLYCSDGNNIFTIDSDGDDYSLIQHCAIDTKMIRLTIIDNYLYYLVSFYNSYEYFPPFYVKYDLSQPLNISNNGLFEKHSIYPNPANDEINIILSNSAPITEVNIYNQLGQNVIRKFNVYEKLNISRLKNGIYIIEITSNDIKYREKLIIKK